MPGKSTPWCIPTCSAASPMRLPHVLRFLARYSLCFDFAKVEEARVWLTGIIWILVLTIDAFACPVETISEFGIRILFCIGSFWIATTIRHHRLIKKSWSSEFLGEIWLGAFFRRTLPSTSRCSCSSGARDAMWFGYKVYLGFVVWPVSKSM